MKVVPLHPKGVTVREALEDLLERVVKGDLKDARSVFAIVEVDDTDFTDYVFAGTDMTCAELLWVLSKTTQALLQAGNE